MHRLKTSFSQKTLPQIAIQAGSEKTSRIEDVCLLKMHLWESVMITCATSFCFVRKRSASSRKLSESLKNRQRSDPGSSGLLCSNQVRPLLRQNRTLPSRKSKRMMMPIINTLRCSQIVERFWTSSKKKSSRRPAELDATANSFTSGSLR